MTGCKVGTEYRSRVGLQDLGPSMGMVPGPRSGARSECTGDVRIGMRKSYPARFGAQHGDRYQVHRCRTHCGNGVSARGSVPSDVVLLGAGFWP